MKRGAKGRVSDAEFVELLRAHGPLETARRIGVAETNVFSRRKRLEKHYNISIAGPDNRTVRPKEYPQRVALEVKNGIVIVAGDAHYWPGPASIMHKALVAACKEYKPKAIILNGDVIDAPTVSRHAPIGWEGQPKLADEIEAAQERTHEIVVAAGRAQRAWNLGNHDSRFETRLATVAREYAKMRGVHLSDHFPLWAPAWSTWINGDVVVKHRFKGGMHAAHNGTLWSGKSIIVGHLHSAKVAPITDYNGTRYGVDGGCIADTDHAAFTDYTEDNPKDWRSAFVMLTFKDGKLLQPELVLKWDDQRVQFRGAIFAP